MSSVTMIEEVIETKEPKIYTGPVVSKSDVLKIIREEAQVELAAVVIKAKQHAETTYRAMLEDMEKKLEAFPKPKNVVMHVQVKDIKVQLDEPASPILGDVLVSAQLGDHVLVKGPAGSGKSTLGRQVAKALNRPFFKVNGSAGITEGHLMGRVAPDGKRIDGEVWRAVRDGGVLLVDELDAFDPNVLMVFQNLLDDSSHIRNHNTGEECVKHKDFFCIATANTFGLGADMTYTARDRLDGATLNRFAGHIFELPYDETIEEQVCPDNGLRTKLQKARQELLKKKSTEIISTRTLAKAYKLKKTGLKHPEIYKRITCSWPEGLAQQVGLGGSSEGAGDDLPF